MGEIDKTIGELIDELITTNLRSWHAQDIIMDTSLSESIRLDAAITAQTSNAKRNKLISAINEILGDDTLPGKTYDNN